MIELLFGLWKINVDGYLGWVYRNNDLRQIFPAFERKMTMNYESLIRILISILLYINHFTNVALRWK